MQSETKEQLLKALRAIERGDFSVAMDEHGDIADRDIAQCVNRISRRLDELSSEISRVSREIGVEGVFGGQSEVDGLEGRWRQLETDFNSMAAALTLQIREFANALRDRDRMGSRRITVQASGETEALRDSLNSVLASCEH